MLITSILKNLRIKAKNNLIHLKLEKYILAFALKKEKNYKYK